MGNTNSIFFTPRAAHFMNRINNEIINKVIGQSVLFFQLKPELVSQDKYASLYKENSKKIFEDPVRIPCTVIMSEKRERLLDDAVSETESSLEVNFNREYLKTINIMPNNGDVIGFQRIFYEIYNVDDSKMRFGSPEFKFDIQCLAHIARFDVQQLKMQFDNEV